MRTRIKILYLAILIVIPVLIISFGPFSQDRVLKKGKKLNFNQTHEWRSQAIDPITNAEERAAAVDGILRKANIAAFGDPAIYSDTALKETLTRLLAAFARPEGLDFNAKQGAPDFENYRQLRGFDLADARSWKWDTALLKQYEHYVGNPLLLRRICPSANLVPGDGRNETSEARSLLNLMGGVFDRFAKSTNAGSTNRSAIYCNGHWISIAVKESILVKTNISPQDFLQSRPNLGVHAYPPSLKIDTGDPQEQLLF